MLQNITKKIGAFGAITYLIRTSHNVPNTFTFASKNRRGGTRTKELGSSGLTANFREKTNWLKKLVLERSSVGYSKRILVARKEGRMLSISCFTVESL